MNRITFILIFLSFISFQGIMTQTEINMKKNSTQDELDEFFMNEAIKEAKLGLSQGGIPIGAVIVVDNKVIGRGHNMRVQNGSPIQHGEMNAFDNAGRQPAEVYKKATLYTTLSPCQMCSGTTGFYNIPRIVVAENKNFKDPWGEDLLRKMGREVKVMNNIEAYEMMRTFIENNPDLWNEDISKENKEEHSQKLVRELTEHKLEIAPTSFLQINEIKEEVLVDKVKTK